MISRTTQSLLGAVGVLALAIGIAEVHPPTGQAAVTGTAVRTAVQNSGLVCPPPLQGSGSTVYSLAAPGSSSSTASSGSASLTPLSAASGTGGGSAGSSGSAAPALVQQTALGGATTAKATAGDKAPALIAAAEGTTAPGFTVQQTTTNGSSVSGTSCTESATDFWFVGADSDKGSNDYVELTNVEDVSSDVDIQIFNPSGEVEGTSAANIEVPAGQTVSLLLSALLGPGNADTSLAVHVIVHTGRIAAALHADSGSEGADWVPATTLATSQVIAGLPGDLSDATLVVADPGAADADLSIHLAWQGGLIVPSGHDTIHVKAGQVTSVDLGAITKGQPAALVLTPSGVGQTVPFIAGVQVVRGKSGSTDTGYLAGAASIGQRATAAGNTAGTTTLLLSDPGTTAAAVKVSSLGAGGAPVVQTVQVAAGTTVSVTPQAPSGAGTFAVTVEPVSGGPVYAARMIGTKDGSGFTVQQLADDRSTVQIPQVVQDGSILMP